MSSKKKHNSTQQSKWNSSIWFLLLLPLGAFVIWSSPKDTTKEKKPTAVHKGSVIGKADGCATNPLFPQKEGLQPPYFIDLRQAEGPGLRIIEAKKNGKILKMKGWEQAGMLGPHTLDKDGTIYTAPVPFVNLLDRPPLFYNQIFRIDPQTGEMSSMMHLPFTKRPGEQNPYGVVGMAYDCSDHSIYVSTLAGSDADEEVGRIYHIDIKSKKILHVLEGVDALGLGIFTMKSGKRLFYGSARSPEIFSVGLDNQGGFDDKPLFEFSLAAMEGGSYDNAHRVRFLNGNKLKIKGIEFSYSLMAASDPQRNIYMFDYNPATDKWDFAEAHPQ